jgi:hypothetical protein
MINDQTSPEYFDRKWNDIIPRMPVGGGYNFPKRQHGLNIIKDHIDPNSKVFDFACGLGVIDKQLKEEKGCIVSGCDFSQVAVDYCNQNTDGDFRKTDTIFGDVYDYIIAIYFLEHIKDPVGWLHNCFNHAPKVICAIPNDFNIRGEHIDMQWKNWDSFYELFNEFKVDRLDIDKYSGNVERCYKHPIILFQELA